MSEIKTPPANKNYREGWDRVFGWKTCDICLGKVPYQGGPIPIVLCECGNCKCEDCIEGRKRALAGLPPAERPTGGFIHPKKEE